MDVAIAWKVVGLFELRLDTLLVVDDADDEDGELSECERKLVAMNLAEKALDSIGDELFLLFINEDGDDVNEEDDDDMTDEDEDEGYMLALVSSLAAAAIEAAFGDRLRGTDVCFMS